MHSITQLMASGYVVWLYLGETYHSVATISNCVRFVTVVNSTFCFQTTQLAGRLEDVVGEPVDSQDLQCHPSCKEVFAIVHLTWTSTDGILLFREEEQQ